MISVPNTWRIARAELRLGERILAGFDRSMGDIEPGALIRGVGVAQGVLAARIAWSDRGAYLTEDRDVAAELAKTAALEALAEAGLVGAMAAGCAFLNRRNSAS